MTATSALIWIHFARLICTRVELFGTTAQIVYKVVVMTHQRLNIGDLFNYEMQRKPIANKYRKGTMKSTLQARILLLAWLLSGRHVVAA